jgi:hypothetical protein
MITKIEKEEFLEFARKMENYHGVFSQLWRLGKPAINPHMRYPTACVMFDREGECVDFQFHPEYWEKSSDTKKQFTISHECLHVILNHGKRIKAVGAKDQYEKEIANMAADIVINESLVKEFGFDRDEIDPIEKDKETGVEGRKFCWLDTLFKEEDIKSKKIRKDGSFEYYYYKLKNEYPKNPQSGKGENGEGEGVAGKGQTVDDHDGLESFDEKAQEIIQEELEKNLSEEELEDLSDKLQNTEATDEEGNHNNDQNGGQKAGSIAGNISVIVKVGKVKKKKKWETVIKKWTRKHLKASHKDMEQWAITNRRFTLLPQDMFLPSEFEVEEDEFEKSKIDVLFYQDTSGSCVHLAERFFKAAMSLPEERFNIHMCCFDTQVYETTIASKKLYGFGGTSFDILERYIQSQLSNGKMARYPDAVFVITDGYGNKVMPAKPKNWYWFLSTNYTSYIPKECNTFDLSKFE